MLANFLYKNNNIKLHAAVCLFVVFFCLHLFSQKASNIENITETNGLVSNYVFNANEDQDGIIWLGTNKGLVKYQDGNWVSFDADNGMPGNYINKAIADDKNGLLLYLSERGLYFFDTKRKAIVKKYSEIKTNNSVDFRKSSYNKNYIIIRVIDSKLEPEKFLAFDINNKNLILLKVENKQIFLTQNNTKEKLADLELFSKPEKIIFKNYFLEPIKEGVLRIQNGKIIDTITEKNGLGNNFINHILKTKKGDIIISSLGGGISLIRENNPKIFFSNKNNNARNIIDYQGKKYILSDGYLYILEKDKLTSKIFLKKDALSFLIDNDLLYVGSFSGLETYHLRNNSVKFLEIYPLNVGISKICKADNKIIFTTYGNGIFVKEGNTIKNYKNIPFNNIENCFKMKNGYAMISHESGVNFVDENFNFLQHVDKNKGLSSNFATCFFANKDTIYIGTKKGITAYFDNKIVTNFTKENGFIGDFTRSIFKDESNRIWVLTDKNLFIKTKDSLKPLGSLKILDHNEDLILMGNYSSEDNALTVVSKNKITEIAIDKIVPNTLVKSPNLLKILQNGELVDHQKNIFFEDHNKNIHFIFSSVDQDLFGSTKLFYKINNDAWKPFKEARNLKFSFIDQGKYTLQVKSVNEDGYQSLMQDNIEFTVLGPFFLRWWFLLSMISFVSYFFYNYINNINKKKYIKRLNLLRVKHQLENERKRISRDLHDNIGAYVTRLISKIDHLKNTSNNKNAENEKEFDDVRLDTEHIMALLRQTIWVLGTQETTLITLYDNFKTYARKFLQNDKIRIIFEESIDNNRKFDSSTGSGIFRIMQEALQNIYKHAHATKVVINIISKEKIIIIIEDNGNGIKENELVEGNGIINMRERARELGFKFNIYSDNTGTTIELYEM